MKIKNHLPNFITCLNLLCGCAGIAAVFESELYYSAYFILLACIFDFLDGFAARILNAASPIGKELDSLADVVTFGVLPGFIIYNLYQVSGLLNLYPFLFLLPFLIPVFSALRLAKFNMDTRQTDSFIGLPTPANAILIASFPLILLEQGYYEDGIAENLSVGFMLNHIFLILIPVVMSALLIAEIKLFALKFNHFGWKENKIIYIFLSTSILMLVLFKYTAIPFIIILYLILSLSSSLVNKREKRN